MGKSKSTHLYVLKCNELYKIGVTNNIDRRVKTLQTGNASPIVVEYIEERYKPHKAEHYLHQQFSTRRVNGEWFRDLTVRDIRSTLLMFHDQEEDPRDKYYDSTGL
jgi:hypothetical protein